MKLLLLKKIILEIYAMPIFSPSNRNFLNQIGHDIIGCAFEVRNTAGRYFRESYYKHALAHELTQKGHSVQIEQILPALYKGIEIQNSLKMDLLVDECVVVEVKAIPQIGNSEYRQLMTYLMLSNYQLGYIINFGVENFTISGKQNKFDTCHGIYRFVNHI
ncbi:MAG: GxxExxY protein [Muribaculaceae bacterium]|nr:GxxExxY protein [Muribaculaceae bacterium]